MAIDLKDLQVLLTAEVSEFVQRIDTAIKNYTKAVAEIESILSQPAGISFLAAMDKDHAEHEAEAAAAPEPNVIYQNSVVTYRQDGQEQKLYFDFKVTVDKKHAEHEAVVAKPELNVTEQPADLSADAKALRRLARLKNQNYKPSMGERIRHFVTHERWPTTH